jgi:hypothetical protein
MQALTSSKNQAARRVVEVVQSAHVMDLEQANAELRAELEQAHLKITEAEERHNSISLGYTKLEDEYESLCNAAKTLKWEKAEDETAREPEVLTIRTKFQDYHVRHCMKLCNLWFHFEKHSE